ncbi:unnamed protein product [Diamesa hyperborea]
MMRKIQVLLLLVHLSSVLFVKCSVNEEISQFSWDLFKFMALETDPFNAAIVNNNIVMNGFGPQLLLLEAMLGAKGKTYEEIKDIAKSSAHYYLSIYYEHLKCTPRMKDLKIRLGNFATSQAKFHDTFLNEIFERNVEFRTTDFHNQVQSNKLMEMFYKNINYKHEDTYLARTQMVMKSSTSLDFHMNCHGLQNERFHIEEGDPQSVPTAKLLDNIKGGSIKNSKGTFIAEWAEVPTEYLIDNDISIIFVKPDDKFTVNEVLPQIMDLKTRHIPLLIGKLADPLSAKPDSDKQTHCKIPVVENGYIWDPLFGVIINSEEIIDVDMAVLVKCNSNYFLQKSERTRLWTCKSYGWNSQFPKCQKMCQVNDLRSHSAVITCEKNGTPIDCSRSVASKVTATVRCNSRYNFEPNAQKTFVCQENGQWDGERTECKADCGQLVAKGEAATANAREVDPHEIPWHATIYYKDNQICGGTIISELIIISAAHCFRTDLSVGVLEIVKSEFKVIVGKLYRDINATEPDITQSLDVVDIRISDFYEGIEMKFQGDFAVVTVNEVIVFRNHIAPACLNIDADGMDQQLPDVNQLGILAGFGLTEYGIPSEKSKKIELPYVKYSECRAAAPKDYRSFLLSDKFCAGFTDGTGYVCNGDSGGGLVFVDDRTQKYHLLGIFSNTRSVGEDKCDPHFYSLYTNIYMYLDIVKKEHTKSRLTLRDMIDHPKTLVNTFLL